MFGLDERIAQLGAGDATLIVIAVAIVLGLRHATDPDHLTAVSTLIASDERHGSRRAGVMGAFWGLGHASTLFALGLPIVLFDSYLPDWVQTGAEVAIGIVIMGLAVRLLWLWRRGRFHAHEHRHGDVVHRHLHPHAEPEADPHDHGHARAAHDHAHPAGIARSPAQAYGIGLVHGIGGSAGVGVLLLAAIPSETLGVAALVAFALFTAVSMALASTAFGWAITREPVADRWSAVTPALGTLSLAFGAWYALGALGAVPYVL